VDVFHLHLTAKAFSMKKPIMALLLIIALLLTAPVYAEIYKYIDENGQKRWTDDLSQVPKDQRSSAQRIETEKKKPAGTIAEEAGKSQPVPPPGIEAALPNNAEPGEGAELNRDALEKEKADLDSQYQQLIAERKQLEQMQTEDLSAAARMELNERISVYNNKMDKYDKQLNSFNEKANAYNQKIISQKQPAPSE
jgi:DNA primase